MVVLIKRNYKLRIGWRDEIVFVGNDQWMSVFRFVVAEGSLASIKRKQDKSQKMNTLKEN